MSNTKTTKKETVKTPNTKEKRVMSKKKDTVVTNDVVVENKKVTKKVKENEKKVNLLTIQEVVELYDKAGIKCYNTECKGNYRIMGGKKGSSLNIKPTKGYYIYTTEEDFAKITENGIKKDDLIIEAGTNAQDHSRPNTVICTETSTLEALLMIYAENEYNKVALA